MNNHRPSRRPNGFCEWLQDRLEKSGLDIKEAASRAGITQSYLSMLARGKRTRPSAEKVVNLAVALGADPDEALTAANLSPSNLPAAQPSPSGSFPTSPRVPVVGWAIEADGSTLELEVREGPDRIPEYRIRIELKSNHDLESGPSVRERLLGVGEGLTFSLRPGGEPMRWSVDPAADEMVLRIPLSLLHWPPASRSPSHGQQAPSDASEASDSAAGRSLVEDGP